MSQLALRWEEPVMFEHTSVLVERVVAAVAPQPGGIYLDVTSGGGGHSEALLRASLETKVYAFDRDQEAVTATRLRLLSYQQDQGEEGRAVVTQASFEELPQRLGELELSMVDGIIADLGVSSHQIDSADRGMSFRFEGPLDMRMDKSSGQTALELISTLSQEELADVIYQYGEERRSRRVARCIKQALEQGELETTLDLRRAVVRAVGPQRTGGLDPATRTFQALRIAVNRELEQLKFMLALAETVLRPGGVLAIISFHSLEDRLVKRTFAEKGVWEPMTKKPVVPSAAEQQENPRSRSAKLRAARRLSPAEVSTVSSRLGEVLEFGRRR